LPTGAQAKRPKQGKIALADDSGRFEKGKAVGDDQEGDDGKHACTRGQIKGIEKPLPGSARKKPWGALRDTSLGGLFGTYSP